MYLPQMEGKNCHLWLFGSICAGTYAILERKDGKFLVKFTFK
jgi:hypothetical protein